PWPSTPRPTRKLPQNSSRADTPATAVRRAERPGPALRGRQCQICRFCTPELMVATPAVAAANGGSRVKNSELSSRSVIFLGQVRDTGCPRPAVESPPVSTSESRATASPEDLAVTAERCAAQLLRGEPAGSAEKVAGRLLA